LDRGAENSFLVISASLDPDFDCWITDSWKGFSRSWTAGREKYVIIASFLNDISDYFLQMLSIDQQWLREMRRE